jgi:hypothetical protein
MNRFYCVAAAAAAIGLACLPASGVFAQGTAAGAAAAPAAGAAPATTAAPPPAATTTAPPPAATTTTTTEKPADDKSAKKKTAKKSSQSELDRSIDSKTVPSRYKSQIPKEYHGHIPWGR